jgi:hypothetical protein
LAAKLLGTLKIKPIIRFENAQCRPQIIVGAIIHANQNTAALRLTASKVINLFGDETPTAQIEETNAEVSAVGRGQGRRERRKELVGDIIKNASHECFRYCAARPEHMVPKGDRCARISTA